MSTQNEDAWNEYIERGRLKRKILKVNAYYTFVRPQLCIFDNASTNVHYQLHSK